MCEEGKSPRSEPHPPPIDIIGMKPPPMYMLSAPAEPEADRVAACGGGGTPVTAGRRVVVTPAAAAAFFCRVREHRKQQQMVPATQTMKQRMEPATMAMEALTPSEKIFPKSERSAEESGHAGDRGSIFRGVGPRSLFARDWTRTHHHLIVTAPP